MSTSFGLCKGELGQYSGGIVCKTWTTNLETSLDAIIDLWSSLAQVCPFVRVISEAVLVCLLRRPDYTGCGTRRIETGVRLVAFVRFAEVAVDAGAQFWW
jgi:hypothetical protein